MGTVRRISALTLVLTLSSIGIPLPAHAADEESLPLTINGLPLSQLLNRTAPGDPLPPAALLGQETGQISGVLLDEDGQPLTDGRVELERPSSEGQGRLVTATGADGAFSCTGLGPGRYEVQHRVDDEVVATSARIDLAAGEMQVSGISVAADPEGNPNWWQRRSTGAKVGIMAGIGFGVLIVLMAADCADGQGSYIGPCG